MKTGVLFLQCPSAKGLQKIFYFSVFSLHYQLFLSTGSEVMSA